MGGYIYAAVGYWGLEVPVRVLLFPGLWGKLCLIAAFCGDIESREGRESGE